MARQQMQAEGAGCSPARKLPRLSLPERLCTKENRTTLSLYNDPLATDADLKEAVQRLSAAFPMPKTDAPNAAMFFALLVERLRDNKFTGNRLRDAVNHIIDNCRYKQISIADIVQFDKAARLYTYAEYAKAPLSEKDDFSFMYDADLNPVKIGGVCYFIRISENPDSVLAYRAAQVRRRKQVREEIEEETENILSVIRADIFHEQPDLPVEEAREMAIERFRETEKYKQLKNKYYEIPRDV